jgi:hypothetical protein
LTTSEHDPDHLSKPEKPTFPMRRLISHPALALGSTLLWGAIELLALLRSRWNQPGRPHRG